MGSEPPRGRVAVQMERRTKALKRASVAPSPLPHIIAVTWPTSPTPDLAISLSQFGLGVAKDLFHGVARFLGVTFLDSASSGGVIGKILFEPAIDAVDGDYKDRAQNCVD